MKKIFLALMLALTPALAYGADVKKPVGSVVVQNEKFELPAQKIEGADAVVELGELVSLNLSKIEKLPSNFVSYTVEWKVFDRGIEKKNFQKNNAGDGIYFGSGITKRKITVFAAVSYLYVVKEGDKLVEAGVRSQFLTATVDVGGANPGPGPGPGPDEPDPVFPDGVFKLASKSYSLAKEKVSGDKRAVAAAEISKSFSTLAAKIAAGQELNNANDIKAVLQEATTANQEAVKRVGVSNDVWNAFFEGLQEEIYGLYTSGKLKTKNDFAAAWREIGEGLSKVK